MRMNTKPQRRLLLTDYEVGYVRDLGNGTVVIEPETRHVRTILPVGPYEFLMPAELWSHIRRVCQTKCGVSLVGPSIDAEAADVLAGFLERALEDEGWQIFLWTWGDPRGVGIRGLIRFLKGGELSIRLQFTSDS